MAEIEQATKRLFDTARPLTAADLFGLKAGDTVKRYFSRDELDDEGRLLEGVVSAVNLGSHTETFIDESGKQFRHEVTLDMDDDGLGRATLTFTPIPT